MSFEYLLILAMVQGLTEFLPVSSSGHLVLLPYFLGEADQGQMIDVALHMGTLLAILVYYIRDFWFIAVSFLKWNDQGLAAGRRLGMNIVVATVPAVIVGYALHEIYPEGIRSVPLIAANIIVFGVVMGLADRFGQKNKTIADVHFKSAFIMGLAQALALVPGVSRSGVTMSAGRFLGFNRSDAARVSFLMGTPAMFGAGLLDLKDVVENGATDALHDAAIAAGLSFVFGFAAIHFMMRWLQRFGLMPFVVYRLALGLFLIFYLMEKTG